MTLKPEKNITKILLSTSSYLVGEYEEENFLLSIAFAFDKIMMLNQARNQALAHEYFILAAKMSESHDLTDYSPFGDALCIYLSILYGKRFDNHGLVEGMGIFWLPNNPPVGFYNSVLPFNSRKPRPDLEIPLNLQEIKRISPLLLQKDVDLRFKHFLWSAGRFYVHALQHAESEPETAFLDLISCDETLSYFFEYEPDDLLNRQIKGDLVKIAKQIEGGDEVGSLYVHTGQTFGGWVEPCGSNWEVPIGKPIIEDKELVKILVRSPTLIGMERIIRFCLLRFIHLYGTPVDSRLDGAGLADTDTDGG
jgi:hypothetical protein